MFNLHVVVVFHAVVGNYFPLVRDGNISLDWIGLDWIGLGSIVTTVMSHFWSYCPALTQNDTLERR